MGRVGCVVVVVADAAVVDFFAFFFFGVPFSSSLTILTTAPFKSPSIPSVQTLSRTSLSAPLPAFFSKNVLFPSFELFSLSRPLMPSLFKPRRLNAWHQSRVATEERRDSR